MDTEKGSSISALLALEPDNYLFMAERGALLYIIFSSIPDPYTLNANRNFIPLVTAKKCLQTLPNVPRGTQPPLVETHWCLSFAYFSKL